MRNEAFNAYLDSKAAQYTSLQKQIQVNGFLSSGEPPLHQEPFKVAKTATLDVAQMLSEKKKTTDGSRFRARSISKLN